MFMFIREGSAGVSGGGLGGSVIQEKTAKQVQAAVRKQVERQRRQNSELNVPEEMDNASVHSRNPSTSTAPKQEKEPEQENPDLLAALDGVYGPDRELQEDEMEELREGFKEFEYKNKGIVKCESLGECMRTMGYMPTEMRLIELSETLRSGKVDFEDFSDLMGPKVVEDTTHMIGIREMKEAFQEIDADGDGQISAAELKEAMKSLLGEQLSPAELEEILQDADLNGDGQIDFEEFVRMMSH
ncbi:calcium-binding protein 2-like [Paramormyrops kingsleyae]|uniref:calcium-binding protein 2-like n=1 Tax=Paramormyrops kingsleyae TaxID=1676925 RepID=UPI003B97A8C5